MVESFTRGVLLLLNMRRLMTLPHSVCFLVSAFALAFSHMNIPAAAICIRAYVCQPARDGIYALVPHYAPAEPRTVLLLASLLLSLNGTKLVGFAFFGLQWHIRTAAYTVANSSRRAWGRVSGVVPHCTAV